MTANNLLMQTLADVLDAPVVRPMVAETTCLGAAYAAGLAVGFWPDTEDAARQLAAGRRVDPADGRGRSRPRVQGLAQGRRAHHGLARRGGVRHRRPVPAAAAPAATPARRAGMRTCRRDGRGPTETGPPGPWAGHGGIHPELRRSGRPDP